MDKIQTSEGQTDTPKKINRIFRISYRNKRISYRDFKSNEIYITKFTLHFKTLTIIKKAIKAQII